MVDGIQEKLMNLTTSLSTIIFGFLIGFARGWQLALIVTCIMPFMALAGILFSKVISMVGDK